MFLIKRDCLPLRVTVSEKKPTEEQWEINIKLYHIVGVRHSFSGGNYTS